MGSRQSLPAKLALLLDDFFLVDLCLVDGGVLFVPRTNQVVVSLAEEALLEVHDRGLQCFCSVIAP